jgi:hypothetical protein
VMQQLLSRLRLERPFDRRESVVASLGLVLVAALALGPFVKHGGFFLDDWANGAGALQPPGSPDIGKGLSFFAEITSFRPVLIIYVPLTYFILGTHVHLQDAWSVLVAVIAGSFFYGVLRSLGVPWIHAWLIAALTIVFPWSDATRFWVTGDQVNLSIAIMWCGLLLALIGLRVDGVRWHVGAGACYLISIFTYEITLPLIVTLGLVYWLRAGWRAARVRWLADLAVAVAAGSWVATHTKRTTSGVGADVDHLGEIISGGGTILGRAGMPLGSSRTTLVLIALGVTLALGLALYRHHRRRRGAERGWGLKGWLCLSAAGLWVAALGWVMFIPADPYYTPSVYGLTNRVNGLAGFGVIMLVYGAFGVVGYLVARLRPAWAQLSAVVTIVLAVALLGSYTHVLRRHITIWSTAYDAETRGLSELKSAMPTVPRGTTIFVSSYPANQTLGVPIFSTTWDFDGMVKLEYDDFSVAGYPIVEGQHLACGNSRVLLVGEAGVEAMASYGTARLFDFETHKVAVPQDMRMCKRIVGRYVPGPLYLSLAY